MRGCAETLRCFTKYLRSDGEFSSSGFQPFGIRGLVCYVFSSFFQSVLCDSAIPCYCYLDRKKGKHDFFRREALKEQFGKEPSTVRCLAVKSALLGTRHPRKEKEAALQNVTGEPACLCGEIIVCHSIGDRTKHLFKIQKSSFQMFVKKLPIFVKF